ncbi:MAG: sulfatase-like hydrolase/transferase [Opitutales bacterium]|nr:sulfatase-like hydrolase/transferase [Opitutales bacterium]MBT5170642.1 sulfatase-like hydrolase/transferase [Opitutales bacterium]MBT5815310.1 sulfatase-like hydrolase/transferase [Opitutales bacterium]
MKCRVQFCSIIFATIVLAAFSSCSRSPDSTDVLVDRPNIVYIISDDQYYQDFGFMGNDQVITPNLDRLAEQSAFYPNGYVPSSVCRPSLATLLTGLYPHQHGIHFNHPPPGFQGLTQAPEMTKDRYDRLRETGASFIKNVDTLPRRLTQYGYRCLQTGKHWEGHWSNAGFTEGMTLSEPSGGANGDKVLPNGDVVAHGNGDAGLAIGRVTMKPIVDFLDDCGEDQPFLIWYAPFLPHTPHDSPGRYFQAYSERSVDPHRLPYYASITQFDETVGELVDMIESRGLSRKTLFVFLSDNGFEPLESNPKQYTEKSKRSPFEPGLRTPILLRWDGKISPGQREEWVSSIDLFPTILDASDIDAESPIPGLSLFPNAASYQELPVDRTLFGEIYPGDASVLGDPSIDVAYRWIRQGNLKLIVPASEEPWGNYVDRESLFDLEIDPNETNNLAGDQQYDSMKTILRASLDKWWSL